MQIYVTDGSDNRLKQFDNAEFRKGVHQNEIQLSDSPVLGSWKIHVKVNNDKEVTKEFEVAEYTLPKFEFSIDANPDSNYKEGKISATVRAKYTFGKIAKGNAAITVKGEGKSVSRTVEVNGKKNVEFTHEELGIKKSFQEKTVNIFGTFTEELSGKEQNATAKVQIHVTPEKIRFTKSGEKFKPGLPFKVTALVNYHDKNAPVTDKSNPVKFTTKIYTLIEKKCKRTKSKPIESRFGERNYGWNPSPSRPTYNWSPSYSPSYNPPSYNWNPSPPSYNPQYTPSVPSYSPSQRSQYTPSFTSLPSPSNYGWISSPSTGWRAARDTSDYDETTSREDDMEEYDCTEQGSYEDIQEIFVKNGKAEVNLDIPSNATKIDVEVSYSDRVIALRYDFCSLFKMNLIGKIFRNC